MDWMTPRATFPWATVIGIYFAVNFVAAFVPAWLAGRKGRGGMEWWFIGLFFGPVVALLALIGAPTMQDEIDAR